MLNRIEVFECIFKESFMALLVDNPDRPERWMIVTKSRFSPGKWEELSVGDTVPMQYQSVSDGATWVPIEGGRYAKRHKAEEGVKEGPKY